MATNWVDEVKSGATSTGSKALSLADESALTISNTSSDTLFQVKSDTTNGGFTSILGIEDQEAVLFLGADNGDDTADVWQIQSDTSGNFKIGNRTSGTGSPARENTITDAITIDTSRNISVGVDDTGYDVKFFGATSGQYLLWDESADELVLAGDSKLSFHDAAGGENIIATSDGHLEINAGTTLDITAPAVDLNGTLDVSSTSTLTGLVTASAGVKLGNNIIYASDGGTAITLDTSDNVAITGDLTVTGNDIKSSSATAITLSSDDVTVVGDLTVTGTSSGTVTLGADADGTDRSIIFGHSTLKSIMGIDDSADRFVINTDASFDGTIADNDFSIDASGNAYIKGDLTVTGGKLTFGNGEVFTNETDEVLYLEAPTVGVNAVTHSRNAIFALIADTDTDSELRFMEGSNNKWAIGHDASASDELCWMQNAAINESTAKMKLTTSGDLSITGNLELTGGTLTVGADDTGYDVKFFGATAGSYMLWDETNDCLSLTDSTNLKIGDGFDLQLYHDGSDSYIANSTGALKVATTQSGIAVSIGHTTSETSINDNLTVLGDTTVKGSLVFRAQPVVDTTNGVTTYSAANVLQGFLLRNPNGSDRSDIFPTAAQIVAAIPNCAVGSSFRLHIRNTADADETITMTAPDSSVVLSGTMTIAQNYAREFLCQVTNVTGSSESINIFSLGTYIY